jgi:hypothetical protein
MKLHISIIAEIIIEKVVYNQYIAELIFTNPTLITIISLFIFIVIGIITPYIIGKVIKNKPLKCTLLIFFNWIFAVYYFIKAVTEKE